MAEETAPTTPKTTTPRARRTAAAKPATTKAAAPKAPAKTAPKVGPTEPLKIAMEYQADTARYAKFGFPPELQGVVVGNVYAPHGTAKVLVLMVPDENPPAE